MIRNALVAFLFCITSTIANAELFQITKTLPCDKASKLLSLMEDFRESPTWQGKNNKGVYTILLTNKDTKTWTLVLTDGVSVCILDSGQGYATSTDDTVKKEKNKAIINDVRY